MELYIHIPFCVKKCQYCDFLSFAADEATQAAYVEALLREIAYYGPHCSDYLVLTVYIGGGHAIVAHRGVDGTDHGRRFAGRFVWRRMRKYPLSAIREPSPITSLPATGMRESTGSASACSRLWMRN